MAALLLHQNQEDEYILSEPTTFLYNHSAELILKTYLLASSGDNETLKKMGHKISSLVEECKLNGLDVTKSTEAYLKAIPRTGGQVNTRYFEEGLVSRIRQDSVRSLAVSAFIDIASQSFAKSDISLPEWQGYEFLRLREEFVEVAK